MRTLRQLGGGYAHPGYARALAEFGRPRALAASGGWVLERAIPDAGAHDAMGCYPLFACHHWAGLREDLALLAGRLVSLTLVTDPFGDYTEPLLHEIFPDLVSRFKQHFVARLGPARRRILFRRITVIMRSERWLGCRWNIVPILHLSCANGASFMQIS